MSESFAELQRFADVMGAFAAGERYINGVWSTSTDAYVDEVRNYLESATQQFREARSLFAQLQRQYDATLSPSETSEGSKVVQMSDFWDILMVRLNKQHV